MCARTNIENWLMLPSSFPFSCFLVFLHKFRGVTRLIPGTHSHLADGISFFFLLSLFVHVMLYVSSGPATLHSLSHSLLQHNFCCICLRPDEATITTSIINQPLMQLSEKEGMGWSARSSRLTKLDGGPQERIGGFPMSGLMLFGDIHWRKHCAVCMFVHGGKGTLGMIPR